MQTRMKMPKCKLNFEDVLLIRSEYDKPTCNKPEKIRYLAKLFNVSEAHIRTIGRRTIWKNLEIYKDEAE